MNLELSINFHDPLILQLMTWIFSIFSILSVFSIFFRWRDRDDQHNLWHGKHERLLVEPAYVSVVSGNKLFSRILTYLSYVVQKDSWECLTSDIRNHVLPPARINPHNSTGRFSESRLLIRAGVIMYNHFMSNNIIIHVLNPYLFTMA